MDKTAKEFLNDKSELPLFLHEAIEDDIIKRMEAYSEQECDKIQTLFCKPTIELKPLEDLWRIENAKGKFILPDTTTFYKWITKKVLSRNDIREKLWMDVWCATTSVNNCIDSNTPTRYADAALKAFDERFSDASKTDESPDCL